MMNFFKSIGIVFSMLIFVIVAIASLYLSYIVAIGIIIAGLVYVVYQLLSMFNLQT